jgi:hypothetical protein
MNFIKATNSGFGSTNPPLDLLETYKVSNTELSFKKFFNPQVNQPTEIDTDKRPLLDARWDYFIFYNQSEIYHFHSNLYFHIENIEADPNDNDLIGIIKNSHEHLKQSFEERRKEYPFLISVQGVSDDTIRDTFLPNLREVVLHQLK